MPAAKAPSEHHDLPPVGDDLALMIDAALAAGEVAIRYFEGGARSWLKAGQSPVTEADMAVDRALQDHLTGRRRRYGWISEESEVEKPAPPGQRSFVVDPIDGTRGFMDGSDEWTICIALMESDLPVAGVVHNPLRNETYAARLGDGARCNQSPISVSERAHLSGATLAASKKAVRTLGSASGDIAARYVPSLAYRLVGVASGVYDGTISTGRAHIWDVAAAAIIVAEAGGRVTDASGARLDYRAPDRRVPPLVVATPRVHAQLCEALRPDASEDQMRAL